MSMRRIGIFGAAGVLVAVLIIGSVVMSGLKLPSFPSNKGTLVIKLTDAPVELKHLNVTITGLAVHKAEHGVEDGEWISLPFVNDKTSVYVDILALQNITEDLSVSGVTPGNYTKLRMDVSTANATYADNSTVNLIVPPGHIDIIVHFEIKSGVTTTLLVDMTAHISQNNRLAPVLKATVI